MAAIAYAYYASNGKADSLHSAAHMHVIVFPMLHACFTFVLLIIAILVVTMRGRGKGPNLSSFQLRLKAQK